MRKPTNSLIIIILNQETAIWSHDFIELELNGQNPSSLLEAFEAICQLNAEHRQFLANLEFD